MKPSSGSQMLSTEFAKSPFANRYFSHSSCLLCHGPRHFMWPGFSQSGRAPINDWLLFLSPSPLFLSPCVWKAVAGSAPLHLPLLNTFLGVFCKRLLDSRPCTSQSLRAFQGSSLAVGGYHGFHCAIGKGSKVRRSNVFE